ncbi:MAG: hypothetical protein V7731_09880 [Amphritea sp.]
MADDISGVDRILCAALEATRCTVNAQCESGLPRNWNIPDFIEIDLIENACGQQKQVGKNALLLLPRSYMRMVIPLIQGIDKKRVFSIVIDEQSVDLTAAMPCDRVALSVFVDCTPLQ